jgi:CheY-like chemotaxis protein
VPWRTARRREADLVTPPLTILVVDDDPEIRAYVRRSVEALCPFVGEVREAESGHRALEIVGSGAVIDGVITDVQLPGLDGVSLSCALEADASPPIPILLISGDTRRTGDAEEFASGAVNRALLAKPFNARQLSTALRNLLDINGKTLT